MKRGVPQEYYCLGGQVEESGSVLFPRICGGRSSAKSKKSKRVTVCRTDIDCVDDMVCANGVCVPAEQYKAGEQNNYGIRVKDISLPFNLVPLREEKPSKIPEKAPSVPKSIVSALVLDMGERHIEFQDRLPCEKGIINIHGYNIYIHSGENWGSSYQYKYGIDSGSLFHYFAQREGWYSDTRGRIVQIEHEGDLLPPKHPEISSYNELYGDGNKRDYIKEQRKEYNIFDVISVGYKLITAIIALSKEPKPPKVKWVQAGDYKLLERWEIV